ncbi:MAG TPA: glycosyltransferase family 2 protein [Candidatus Binatia bacterium]
MELIEYSVVAPMHNEEGNVEALCEGIQGAMESLNQSYEIIFVNDASTDGTLARMMELQSGNPRFHFVDLESNCGENWALLAGISKARGKIILTIDGDNQNDPSYIPALLAELARGYRVVSGRRKSRAEDFWTRRLPSRVANALIRIVSGVPVHDCGCGLKAYRREVLEGTFVPKGFMNRFSPVILGVKAHEFSEVELLDRARYSGQSHYGLSRIFVVIRDLWALPFAVRGPGRWLGRFRWMQGLLLVFSLLLALWGWWILAGAMLLLALAAFMNVFSLGRFVQAQARPQFRIRAYR